MGSRGQPLLLGTGAVAWGARGEPGTAIPPGFEAQMLVPSEALGKTCFLYPLIRTRAKKLSSSVGQTKISFLGFVFSL